MYLLDTDILSNILKPIPSEALISRMTLVPSQLQLTSSITVGEMVYGAYKSGPRAPALLENLERLFAPLVILPFDESASRRYGEIRAGLELDGIPLDEADLRIGSIAVANRLTVVTGNVRHFQRIPGLRVENWLE